MVITDRDVNILVLAKGKERYVFVFSDDNIREVLGQFGRFASSQDLSFSWYDAAVLADKIRQTQQSKRI